MAIRIPWFLSTSAVAGRRPRPKDFKYMELPGADHGTVITQSMPEIFKFFKDHTK